MFGESHSSWRKVLRGRFAAGWFGAGLSLFALWLSVAVLHAAGGALEIRQGYFWDPTTAKFFYPRGIGYQSWNPPVGANQSFAQVEYDLIEFKKMHANSVRAEMVWNVVQITNRVTQQVEFDWSKPDFLVQQAEKLGLKLFILIGFQYAPDWFPDEWKAVGADNTNSPTLINYANPNARAAYSNYIAQVTSRYRTNRAIGAWILGNEYAYFDLWNPARVYIGYDPFSMASFRAFLQKTHGDIAAANIAWGGTTYADFEAVQMPRVYPANRNNPLFHDLIQWRKHSIGEYVALGARAARQNDPNHLLSYSMIGGLFGEADAFYTCEDGRTIVGACAAAGVPLDFWCINNYAIAGLGSELRAGDFGIGKHQAETGLPVLLSETGHTSTENLHQGADVRQAAAVPTQIWEAVLSGAMGVHIFTWNDRDFYKGSHFSREEGFGIVQQSRQIKVPAYANVARAFERMDELDVANLVAGSSNPPADIQIFWTQSSDLAWARANQELNRVWNTLKRLGYQPDIIRDEEFEAGTWRANSTKAIMLSRSFQMDPAHLDAVVNDVIAAGKHVHAAVDLPGQFNAYHQPNPKWRAHMNTLFGLEAANATPAYDGAALNYEFRNLTLAGRQVFGPFPAGYTDGLQTWKYWKGLSAVAGSTIVTYPPNQPALHFRDLGTAKTAITTLGLGDVSEIAGAVPGAPHNWDLRYDWLLAIYRDHFGMEPSLDLSGPGSRFVFPDYRVCRNGSVLIGLLNGHTNPASIVLKSPALLAGRTIENLTTGGVLATNSDGQISLNLTGDQYVLLYATAQAGDSLVNPSPVKLWFESAPGSVWPDGGSSSVVVGYDTLGATVQLAAGFETAGPVPKSYGASAPVTVTGRGTATLAVPVPDADLNDPDYSSTRAGGKYVWHASTSGGAIPAAHARLPVRLAWGVRPQSLPPTVQPGQTYPVTVNWEELPSYLPEDLPTSLDRAGLWDSLAERPRYAIVLELQSGGVTVAKGEFVTDQATSSNVFQIKVPTTAKAPFTWQASARTAPGASDDLVESFEGRLDGADTDTPGSPPRFAPWTSYHNAENATAAAGMYFDTGVQLAGSDGSQSAFLIYTNPPTVGNWSVFGIERPFPASFSLPPTLPEWRVYSFSCDIREINGHPLNVALQLKSPNAPDDPPGRVHAIQSVHPYTASNGGWQRVTVTLDQFVQPDFFALFDINNVQGLVINIEMLDTSVVYEVGLDNIRWNAPERTGLPGDIKAVYRSDNDSPAPLADRDGDGVPDVEETVAGTNPDVADSDGDGQNDGDERTAGTNPKQAEDFFHIESVRWDEAGKAVLAWRGVAGRHYAVSFADGLGEAPAEFFPVPGLSALTTATSGTMEVSDVSPPTAQFRFYRVTVSPP